MKKIILLAALSLVPAMAQAQTTINPTRLQFTKSLDHDTLLPDGSNMLTGYRMQVAAFSALGVVVTTVDLCKPTPDAAGVITLVNTSLSAACPTGGPLFGAVLAQNVSYVARVSAIGPGGSSVSSDSGQFFLSGPPRPATNVQVKP